MTALPPHDTTEKVKSGENDEEQNTPATPCDIEMILRTLIQTERCEEEEWKTQTETRRDTNIIDLTLIAIVTCTRIITSIIRTIHRTIRCVLFEMTDEEIDGTTIELNDTN